MTPQELLDKQSSNGTAENISKFVAEHEAMGPRRMQIHETDTDAQASVKSDTAQNISKFVEEHEAMGPRRMQIHETDSDA